MYWCLSEAWGFLEDLQYVVKDDHKKSAQIHVAGKQ